MLCPHERQQTQQDGRQPRSRSSEAHAMRRSGAARGAVRFYAALRGRRAPLLVEMLVGIDRNPVEVQLA